MNKTSLFHFEQDMFESFCNILDTGDSPWGGVEFSCEFDYRRGKTDVIALKDNQHLIAFELKLHKWKDALQQAYRNTCFAHSSYVVVTRPVAMRAIKSKQDFVRRKVGLCYVENETIKLLLDAEPIEPLQPWLSEKAIEGIL